MSGGSAACVFKHVVVVVFGTRFSQFLICSHASRHWRIVQKSCSHCGGSMIFKVSRCLPGTPHARRNKTKHDAERNQNNTQKHERQRQKTCFLKAPGQAPKKTTPKPRKSRPQEAKMTPRSGPGGPGSGPRGPKTVPRAPQESPKSRPEAVSERPGWPPRVHLAPRRPPEASRKPCWSPR